MSNPFRPQAALTANPFRRATPEEEEDARDARLPAARGPAAQESTRTRTPQIAQVKDAGLTFGQEAGGLARSLVRGASLGISPRLEAAVRGVPLEDVREEMREYSTARPKTAVAVELLGGALTGGTGLLRSGAAAGARAILPRLVGTAIGQGAISGAAESTGGLKGAVKGAAIGGLAPKAVSAVGRIPGIRRVTKGSGEAATEGYERGSRALADKLEGTPGQRIGRALEPMDVTRTQRMVGEGVPGRVQGPTVQALSTQRSDIAAGRAERLGQVRTEAQAAGQAVERELQGELTTVERETRERAKAAAEDALEAARREAGDVVGTLRGRQARGTAAQLQETIRKQQTAMGDQSYTMIRQIGPPPEVDPNIYQEILRDPVLRPAFKSAIQTIRREASRPEALQQGLRVPRMVEVNERMVPELDVYALDLMRRNVREQAGRAGPNVTGLPRSKAKESLGQIQRLEDRFIAGYGPSEVGEQVRSVRAAYRAEFDKLRALQDGLNLGSAKAGRPSGLLTQSPKELDEVLKRVRGMTDVEREAFQVGAREWFSRAVAESPDDALALAKKFNTPASRERLALAYGDEAVEQLGAFSPRAVGARSAAAAERVRGEAQEVVTGLQQRLATEPVPLFARAERAGALAERAAARGADATTQRQAMGSALGGALTNPERATDLTRLLEGATRAQRGESREILGSMLQRRVQEMATSGKTAQEITQTLVEAEQNPAVRALMAAEIARTVQAIQRPTIGATIPRAFVPSFGGFAARTLIGGGQ